MAKNEMKTMENKTLDVYIDESGNTGDILEINSKQPFFIHGALVLSGNHLIELDAIESKYRAAGKIQSNMDEVKSRNTYGIRAFTIEVIEYIAKRCIFAIEVTEKRYHLVVTMVDNLLPQMMAIEALSLPLEIVKQMHGTFADNIYSVISDDELSGYIECAVSKNPHQLLALLNALLKSVIEKTHDMYAANILNGAIHYLHTEIDSNRTAEILFPVPDSAPNGKKFWFIPYIGSFSNLYARVNYLTHRANLNIIHDEQKEFKFLIEGYKQHVEEFGKSPLNIMNGEGFCDYTFSPHNILSFKDNRIVKDLAWIDILAGFVNRALIEYTNGTISDKYRSLLAQLLFCRKIPATNYLCKRNYPSELKQYASK